MTFQKNSLLFYQGQIVLMLMALLGLIFIPHLGWEIFLVFEIPVIALILLFPKLYNEFVTINEKGILCQRAGETLWEHSWENIAELKSSSRFLLPSVEVITYNKNGKAEPFALPNHYFQLGQAAKKAINMYYKKG